MRTPGESLKAARELLQERIVGGFTARHLGTVIALCTEAIIAALQEVRS